MNKHEFFDRLFAAAKEAGIGECEIYYAMNDELNVEVLNGQIKEYSAANSAGLCFRGVYNGKMGYASSEEMDEDAIDMLVRGVMENAVLIETDDDETIYGGGGEYAKPDKYSPETANMPPNEKIALALSMERTALSQDPRVKRVEGCSYGSMVAEKQIVNSRGLDVSFRSSILGAGVAPIVEEDGNVNYGFKSKFSFRKDDIDVCEIAREAVDEAISGLHASSVPSGAYKVVLRRDVASMLLHTFSGVFSGENARKGMSLLKGREGSVIASESVTIIDDPLLENGFASTPFDAEGVATYAKTVVDRGTLITLLHNRTTANALNTNTTGNASKAGYAAPVRVAPTNFYIQPSDTSYEQLLAMAGDGLLITSIMGMHSGANQISGDFSLGAKGFLIENGKLGHSVEQITIACNFFELLKRVVCPASDLYFARPGASSFGSPSLLIDQISVAGK